MFSFTRFWRPKRARHAYPIGSGRTRKPAPVDAKTPETMETRPTTPKADVPAAPNFASPAALPFVAPLARDGLTVTMRSVVLDAATESPVPPGCNDRTVSFAALVKAADPRPWHDDHWTDCVDLPPEDWPAPSLYGTFDNPLDQTPHELYVMRSHIPEEFGNSALTHKTPTFDEWFKTGESLNAFWAAQESRDAARDRKVAALNRYRKVTTASAGPRTPDALDTGVFATAVQPLFDGPTSRNGVSL